MAKKSKKQQKKEKGKLGEEDIDLLIQQFVQQVSLSIYLKPYEDSDDILFMCVCPY